jgi:hypothetical protein
MQNHRTYDKLVLIEIGRVFLDMVFMRLSTNLSLTRIRGISQIQFQPETGFPDSFIAIFLSHTRRLWEMYP